MKQNYHFNLLFRPEPEGGYTVIVPALPGCVTYGRDLVEAREMAQDAIGGYLKSMKKHGEKVIADNQSFIASVDIAYA